MPAGGPAMRILTVRGERVLLDYVLAALYGVETKALIQAVKRNRARFPPDFTFQLSREDVADLKSQIVTSSWAAGGGLRMLSPSRAWPCSPACSVAIAPSR